MIIFTIGKKSYQMALSKFLISDNTIIQLSLADLSSTSKKYSEYIINKTPIMVFGLAGSNSLPIGKEVYVAECRMLNNNESYWKLDKPLYDNAPSIGVVCYTSDHFVTESDLTEPVIFDCALAYLLKDGFNVVSSWRIVSDNLSEKQLESFKKVNC